jgi:hypothetical protein
MRTVRYVGWILFGATALALGACSPSVSPTAAPETGRAAIAPDQREAALKVIDKAIQAHGGKDALARIHYMTRDGKGTIYASKESQPFTDHSLFAFPDRVNMQWELGGQKVKTQWVLNGDKAWETTNNQTRAMTVENVNDLKQDLYMIWLATLIPLQSNDVEVGILEDGKVDDRPAAVVHVRAAEKIGNRRDVDLSFDKESGLLVKAKDVEKEHFYSGHKDFDGVKMPTREQIFILREKKLDVTFTSWTFPAKASEVEFSEPGR